MEPVQKSMLIAVDGSDQSFEAVRYVGRLLPDGQVKVTLFRVMDLIPETIWDLESGLDLKHELTRMDVWESLQRKSVRDFMERAKQFLMSVGYRESDVSMVVRDRESGIVQDIAREAQKGYDALVVGRHGVSRLKDVMFGSTSSKLLGLLRQMPVCIVGGSPEPGKILIALDSSEGARRALYYAGDMFLDKGSEMLLFHVSRRLGMLHPDFQEFIRIEEGRDWIDRANRELNQVEERMEGYLRECGEELEKKGVDRSRIKTKMVHEEHSRSGAIAREALEGGYGTIVLGRRGLSKMDEFIMGRVSNKVLQMAKEKAVWVVH